MAKKLFTIEYDESADYLLVNNTVWEDHGLLPWQMKFLAERSAQCGGLEFVLTDTPIPVTHYQPVDNLYFFDAKVKFLQQVLYTHDWRGGCQFSENAMRLSERFGTDIAYCQTHPKDLGPDSIVLWYYPPVKDIVKVIIQR
ncbi:hypothetical protein MLDJOKPK_00204 [Salmonella phage SPAsTU]|nr:hypothetical protein MLDJOKPK_00204 [Salmonella phage SPAsTU]